MTDEHFSYKKATKMVLKRFLFFFKKKPPKSSLFYCECQKPRFKIKKEISIRTRMHSPIVKIMFNV